MSIAKRFAELAVARFKKKETPEQQQACNRVILDMFEGVEPVHATPLEMYELGLAQNDEDYKRSLKED